MNIECDLCANPYPFMCSECNGYGIDQRQEVAHLLPKKEEACKPINVSSGEDAFL